MSKDLKKNLPGTKSFSQRNLLYMHQFYRMFPKAGIVNQIDSQLDESKITNQIDSQLAVGESPVAMLEEQYVFYIPWGHIKIIMGKCKNNKDKALFFNIRLRCYVVLEVKVTDFDSSYIGKLGTYVVAVNHQLKEEWMNPTLGLLVCKGMDKVEARYALEASSQPMGVSGYELSKLIPEE